jgi:hypothetical protein
MIAKVDTGAALTMQLVVAANSIKRESVKQCFGHSLYIGRQKNKY